MTDREKLMELCSAEVECTKDCSCEECKAQHPGLCEEETAAFLADLIIADGWIRPPCKVGDKVWLAHFITEEVCEATITHIEYNYYTSPQEWITVEYYSSISGRQTYKTRIDLMFGKGKMVFLSREEAEEALKGADDGQRKAD